MIKLVFSPVWFYGIDTMFELFSVIVTAIIAIYSIKLYKFSGNYRYKFFGLSFFAFAASFVAKMLTNVVLYYQTDVKQSFGNIIIKYNLLKQSEVFFIVGYDIHRLLMLLGLIGIYWLVSKSNDHEHKWIFFYLALIVSLFSFSVYIIFHITTAFLLLFIVRHYYLLCFGKKKAQKTTAHLNFMAFLFILISQILFIFVWLWKTLYVIAEVIQLGGYMLFLTSMILLVFRHGKKKDKN